MPSSANAPCGLRHMKNDNRANGRLKMALDGDIPEMASSAPECRQSAASRHRDRPIRLGSVSVGVEKILGG